MCGCVWVLIPCVNGLCRLCWSPSPTSRTWALFKWRCWELKGSWLQMSPVISTTFAPLPHFLLETKCLNVTVFQVKVIRSVCWSWIMTDYRLTLFTRTSVLSGTKSSHCEWPFHSTFMWWINHSIAKSPRTDLRLLTFLWSETVFSWRFVEKTRKGISLKQMQCQWTNAKEQKINRTYKESWPKLLGKKHKNAHQMVKWQRQGSLIGHRWNQFPVQDKEQQQEGIRMRMWG